MNPKKRYRSGVLRSIPKTLNFDGSKARPRYRQLESKEVKLIELTVPWDTTANMTAALQRKTERYKELTTNIQGNGFKCFNIALEVGTRGVINARNKSVLTHGFKVGKVSSVIKNCSKLALLGSYTLWNARFSADWNGGGYLKP